MENCSLKMERDQIRLEFQGSEAFAVEHLIPVLSKIDWNEKVSDSSGSFDRNLSIRTTHAICMRLGHKSVASENPLQNRVFFPDIKEYTVISQSEEHLVIKTPSSHKYKIGDSVIGWPQHICPTVALHRQAKQRSTKPQHQYGCRVD